MENKKKTTVFQLAVESTPDIKIGFRDGLQALGTNAQRITAQNTRKLEGSVDIDKSFTGLPQEDRRFYLIHHSIANYHKAKFN